MDKKKSILIVSPYFAPENSVASIRFTKIGKYLAKSGYKVDVLCSNMKAQVIDDETLKRDIKWFDKVVRIKFPKLYYLPLKVANNTKEEEGKKNKTGIWGRILNKTVQVIRNEFTSSIWLFVWDRILAKICLNTIRKEKWKYFDVVITTYSPMYSHYVGRYLKRKKKCNVWIADYRDPFLGLQEKKLIPQFIFHDNIKIEREADYITTVSRGTKEQILKEAGRYHDEIRRKIHVIYNGYDLDDRRYIKKSKRKDNKLQMAYCGTLGIVGNKYEFSPEKLFMVLRELEDEGKVDINKIELIYAGSSSIYLREYASRYCMLEIIRDCGYVTRKESLGIQEQADIVLMCSWNTNTKKGVLTGKFYEALLLEKTVLALVSGDLKQSEIKEIIQNYNIGFCYEESVEGDYQKLKEWVMEKYQEKMKIGEIKSGNHKKTEKFRHEILAAEMEKIWTG